MDLQAEENDSYMKNGEKCGRTANAKMKWGLLERIARSSEGAYKSVCFDDTQRIIRCPYVLGQATDGNAIDASFCNGTYGLHIDAAGCFQQGTSFSDRNGFSHCIQREVIEQD
jgi:hypothetical protein